MATRVGEMLLAEFDYTMKPAPSIPFIDTTHERRDMSYLKRYGLPAMYWNMILKAIEALNEILNDVNPATSYIWVELQLASKQGIERRLTDRAAAVGKEVARRQDSKRRQSLS